MYCNNCGKVVPEGSKFCDACGYRFGAGVGPFPLTPTSQPRVPADQVILGATPYQPAPTEAIASPYYQAAPQTPNQPYAEPQSAPGRAAPQLSMGITTLLAAIIPGAGHFYAHKMGKGLIFLVGSIVLVVMALMALLAFGASVSDSGTDGTGDPAGKSYDSGMAVAFLILGAMVLLVWIYQIVDAYITAKVYNSRAMQTG